MIGIYGGSFDPPHIGHLGVMQSYWNKFPESKRLLIVPNYISPFKKAKQAREENILTMLRLLISEANLDKTEVEEFEIQRKTASYTIETIEFIREKYGNEDIYLLMGIDSVKDFSSWKNYTKILEYTKLLVFDRDLDEAKIVPKELKPFWDKLVFLENQPIHASSSEIRNLPRDVWNQYLTPKVLQYIRDNGLYLK